MKDRLLASSATFEGITKMIAEWYVRKDLALVRDGDKPRWDIARPTGVCLSTYVSRKGGRFCLMLPGVALIEQKIVALPAAL